MKKEIFLKTIVLLVFLLTSVCATLDTHLFVYPSLSRYLLLEVGAIVLIVVWLFKSFVDKGSMFLTKCQLFVVMWFGYVVFHGFISQTCELYRTVYLCVTLALILALTNLQKRKCISRSSVETILLAVAGLNVVYVILQKVGVLVSGNIYFEVTGCNENPTVTALYLVGCLPIMFGRCKDSTRRLALYVFLSLSVVCIVLLRCRTAYIGLAVEVVVLLSMRLKSVYKCGRVNAFYLCMVGVVFLSLAFVAGYKMYSMKQDSADGRMLIWKLSAEMLVDRPIGHGYGLFEKYYNLKQADYFATRDYSANERKNATFVFMPYNDYLEHGVEGGVVGMLFLFAFYFVMWSKALRMNDHKSMAVFCAFAIMSLFNFVYTSILPWFLIICHASFVVAAEDGKPICKCSQCLASVAMLVPISFLSVMVLGMATAQLKLGKLEHITQSDGYVGDMRFEALEPAIGTSEAFWTKRATNSINQHHYDDALSCIRMARKYSSLPGLFMMEYKCRVAKVNDDKAVACLDTISFMLPRNLAIKHMLIRYYADKNQIRKALFYADDILATGYKVWSEEAAFLTNQAKRFKEAYEKE